MVTQEEYDRLVAYADTNAAFSSYSNEGTVNGVFYRRGDRVRVGLHAGTTATARIRGQEAVIVHVDSPTRLAFAVVAILDGQVHYDWVTEVELCAEPLEPVETFPALRRARPKLDFS